MDTSEVIAAECGAILLGAEVTPFTEPVILM